MEKQERRRLSREDWVRESLELLRERGIGGVKIVVIAERLGATSGSFYWHFKNLQELLDCILEYWERELTDAVIEMAKDFDGSPQDRILNLMVQVIEGDAAIYDHAISIWARNEPRAQEVLERTLSKRYDFARWMFQQSGFRGQQARIRGRVLVAYLMGESANDLKSKANWKSEIREIHRLLASPAD